MKDCAPEGPYTHQSVYSVAVLEGSRGCGRVTNCTSLKETIISLDSSVSQRQCDFLSIIHITLRVEDLFCCSGDKTRNTTINWRRRESQSGTTCFKYGV